MIGGETPETQSQHCCKIQFNFPYFPVKYFQIRFGMEIFFLCTSSRQNGKLQEMQISCPLTPPLWDGRMLVSLVILTDGWRTHPLLLPQLDLLYISFTQPPS